MNACFYLLAEESEGFTEAGFRDEFTDGVLAYGALKLAVGLRLDQEEEFNGADLSIHRITATAEREANW